MDLKNIYNICGFILVLLAIFAPSIYVKVIMIIIGVAMFIIGYCIQTKEKQEREETDNSIKVIKTELEKRKLKDKGIPERFINGLGTNPLFKHFYQVGEEYERKGQYKEAINSYNEILKNSLADEANRVAAFNLIGLSHFELFEFEEAMQNFQMALGIVNEVKVKEERLKSRAATLTNIGLIYQKLEQWKSALKKYKNALQLYYKLDDKLGKANSLYNIYLVYLYLKKPKKALRKIKEAIQTYQEALRVYTLKDFRMNYAMTQSNLGTAYRTLAEVKDKAVNCEKAIQAYQEALRVRTLKDFRMGYAMTQNNLGNAYRTLAQVRDKDDNFKLAIVAYQEAMKVYTKEEFPEVYRKIENNIKNVYDL